MKCESPIWNLLFDDIDLSVWALYIYLYVNDDNKVKKYTKYSHRIMYEERKIIFHKRLTDDMYDLYYLN